MARKTTNDQKPQPARLLNTRQDAAAKLEEQITKGDALRSRQSTIRTEKDLDEVSKARSRWWDFTHELLRRMFDSSEYADAFDGLVGYGVFFPREETLREKIDEEFSNLDTWMEFLHSIQDRLLLIELAPQVEAAPQPISRAAGATATSKTRVFIVHGHDEAAKATVARFLERLELEPVILHEQANMGRTIIEKFEQHADVGFAIVLLTPDDLGAAKAHKDNLQPRARQNVVMELGYFIGRLGRGKVCALFAGGVELPSDMNGVLYVSLDTAGSWHLPLARELKAAGITFDPSKLM